LEVGGYDTRFRLSSDFRSVLMIVSRSRVFRLNSILCEITPGGIADSNLKDVIIEKHLIRRELLNSSFFSFTNLCWTFLALGKLKLKTLIGPRSVLSR
jgi:hypothetical protein